LEFESHLRHHYEVATSSYFKNGLDEFDPPVQEELE
jgi:hypothetical protein